VCCETEKIDVNVFIDMFIVIKLPLTVEIADTFSASLYVSIYMYIYIFLIRKKCVIGRYHLHKHMHLSSC
jgi:hypothetical protein